MPKKSRRIQSDDEDQEPVQSWQSPAHSEPNEDQEPVHESSEPGEDQEPIQESPVRLDRKRVCPDAPERSASAPREDASSNPIAMGDLDEARGDELLGKYLVEPSSSLRKKLLKDEGLKISIDFATALSTDQIQILQAVVNPDSYAALSLAKAEQGTLTAKKPKVEPAAPEPSALDKLGQIGTAKKPKVEPAAPEPSALDKLGQIGELNSETIEQLDLNAIARAIDRAEGNNLWPGVILDNEVIARRQVKEWKSNGQMKVYKSDRFFLAKTVPGVMEGELDPDRYRRYMGQKWMGVEQKDFQLISPVMIIDMFHPPPLGDLDDTKREPYANPKAEAMRPKTLADCKVKGRVTNKAVNELDRNINEHKRRCFDKTGKIKEGLNGGQNRFNSLSFNLLNSALQKVVSAATLGLAGGPKNIPGVTDPSSKYQYVEELYADLRAEFETSRPADGSIDDETAEETEAKFVEFVQQRLKDSKIFKPEKEYGITHGSLAVSFNQGLFQEVGSRSQDFLIERLREQHQKPGFRYPHREIEKLCRAQFSRVKKVKKADGTEEDVEYQVFGHIYNSFPIERLATPEERAKNPKRFYYPMTDAQMLKLWSRRVRSIRGQIRFSIGTRITKEGAKTLAFYLIPHSIVYWCDGPEDSSKNFQEFDSGDLEAANEVAAFTMPEWMADDGDDGFDIDLEKTA